MDGRVQYRVVLPLADRTRRQTDHIYDAGTQHSQERVRGKPKLGVWIDTVRLASSPDREGVTEMRVGIAVDDILLQLGLEGLRGQESDGSIYDAGTQHSQERVRGKPKLGVWIDTVRLASSPMPVEDREGVTEMRVGIAVDDILLQLGLEGLRGQESEVRNE
jgi:hypothetical protein